MGPVAEFVRDKLEAGMSPGELFSRFPPATSQFDLILGQERRPIYGLAPHANLDDFCLPVILSYLGNSIVIDVLDLKQSFNIVSFEELVRSLTPRHKIPPQGRQSF